MIIVVVIIIIIIIIIISSSSTQPHLLGLTVTCIPLLKPVACPIAMSKPLALLAFSCALRPWSGFNLHHKHHALRQSITRTQHAHMTATTHTARTRHWQQRRLVLRAQLRRQVVELTLGCKLHTCDV